MSPGLLLELPFPTCLHERGTIRVPVRPQCAKHSGATCPASWTERSPLTALLRSGCSNPPCRVCRLLHLEPAACVCTCAMSLCTAAPTLLISTGQRMARRSLGLKPAAQARLLPFVPATVFPVPNPPTWAVFWSRQAAGSGAGGAGACVRHVPGGDGGLGGDGPARRPVRRGHRGRQRHLRFADFTAAVCLQGTRHATQRLSKKKIRAVSLTEKHDDGRHIIGTSITFTLAPQTVRQSCPEYASQSLSLRMQRYRRIRFAETEGPFRGPQFALQRLCTATPGLFTFALGALAQCWVLGI